MPMKDIQTKNNYTTILTFLPHGKALNSNRHSTPLPSRSSHEACSIKKAFLKFSQYS